MIFFEIKGETFQTLTLPVILEVDTKIVTSAGMPYFFLHNSINPIILSIFCNKVTPFIVKVIER